MPAQIPLSEGQAASIAEFHSDVVLVEHSPNAEAVEVWVFDEANVRTKTHRSVILDEEGKPLSDTVRSDYEDA